jgi:hypothetical protein
MIRGNFKIVDSYNKIYDNINAAIQKEIRANLVKSLPKIRADVINLTIEALENSPEIRSLSGGKLKFDFGLDFDPTSDIVYAIANSVDIKIKNSNVGKSELQSFLTIYIQRSDFKNLLSLEVASVVTEKGAQLPWLEWLLLAGDAILVSEYSVKYGSFEASRSGGAIMVPVGVFQVDPSFSGTADNNFITRALSRYSDKISQILEKNS